MKFAAVVFALACTLSLPPAPVRAGIEGVDDAFCSKGTYQNGKYTQGCMGTMRGFRQSADPKAFAELQYLADGAAYFAAMLNGVYFGCVFEDSYDAQYFASVAGNFQNVRFAIGAEDGKCVMKGATLFIGSRFTQ